jgi:tetratricopeptide (TPR) repeat protein
VLEKQGKTKEAVEAYQQAIKLLPGDPRPLIALGQLQSTCAQLEEAISLLEAGLAMKPHYAEADARLFLAEVLERCGPQGRWKICCTHAQRFSLTMSSGWRAPIQSFSPRCGWSADPLPRSSMPPIEFSELPGCPFASLTMSGRRARRRVRLATLNSRGSARSRTRTGMALRPRDFKSVSAYPKYLIGRVF